MDGLMAFLADDCLPGQEMVEKMPNQRRVHGLAGRRPCPDAVGASRVGRLNNPITMHLDAFTGWCSTAVNNMRTGMTKNYVLPKALIKKVIPQMADLTKLPVKNHVFYTPISYKVGQLKIRVLRERSEKALGDRFDVREFHDRVLESGCVPLKVLEQKIDRWIRRKGNG
jgi:Bacterial protein of unknown function (DUF885)